jgi:hypothetical protein
LSIRIVRGYIRANSAQTLSSVALASQAVSGDNIQVSSDSEKPAQGKRIAVLHDGVLLQISAEALRNRPLFLFEGS